MLILEIKTQLAKYLSGEITLQDFQLWFAPATWHVDSLDDEELRKLAYDIELAIVEYLSGHLPEIQLKSELAPKVAKITIVKEPARGLFKSYASASQNVLASFAPQRKGYALAYG